MSDAITPWLFLPVGTEAKEGTRRKQSTPGGGLRLHGNSFTRDLSPSLRKPSVGVFGIDEKHVQLSQPSLELRQLDIDCAAIVRQYPQVTNRLLFRLHSRFFRLRCLKDQAVPLRGGPSATT